MPLGNNVTYSSATTSQGTASFAGGQLTILLGSLAVDSQATISVVVQAVVPGTFTTTASITSDEATSNSGNNPATASVVIVPVDNLALSLSATPSPVADGQDLIFTVGVTNNGPDQATEVNLQDTLPAGVTFLSATSNAAGPSPSMTGGVVTAAIGSLAPGSAVTMLITVQPTALPGTNLVDSASVSSAELDSNPVSSTSITVPVRPISNLASRNGPQLPVHPHRADDQLHDLRNQPGAHR